MITFLSVSAAITLCGTVALMFEIFQAPEAYEDETGFHLVWSNNSPEITDIACIWACGAS